MIIPAILFTVSNIFGVRTAFILMAKYAFKMSIPKSVTSVPQKYVNMSPFCELN